VRIRFFLPEPEPTLERLRALDPDREWRELVTGDRAWILQTYLRLARAGRPVDLVGEIPAAGPVLFHAKHERLVRRAKHAGRALLIGVRADNRQPLAAELEILQNGRFADGRRRFALPHWPQPGLVPRDPARGERLERVAFKGFAANLHPELAEPEFAAALAARGLAWDADAVDFHAGEAAARAARWADFREVDAVVALRPRAGKTDFSKPATKLVNAWLAGLPALLGPEYAYRELRRSELDYLEIEDARSALAALDRLRGEPGLYREMVDHGRGRSREVDRAAVLAAWEAWLFGRLPALAVDPRRVRSRRIPLALRRAGRLLERWARGLPAR
jgi:hypothetical protein